MKLGNLKTYNNSVHSKEPPILGSFHLLLKPSAASSVTSQTGRRGSRWEQLSENTTEHLASDIQQSYQYHPKTSPNF